MARRQLTAAEIGILEERGCQAEDWQLVTVSEGFTPGNSFHRVHFSGEVELGVYRAVQRNSDGIVFPVGIDNSSLHDTRVGDNCLIYDSHIAKTDIGDNVALYHVDGLSRRGDSAFANAEDANVLSEDGARAVPLWRHLSAPLAHLLCHLKKHPAAQALEAMIRRDAETLRLPRSHIGSGCRIRRVGTLRDVWIGESVSIDGAAILENCYVDSCREVPTRIGEGVAAQGCVFLRGSRTVGGVRIRHCLVGEGVRLENAFAGEHSLFFANSEFSLGEASSAMAGPYAVSHHKATLILTCQCSFNTFGSAANSSNHHFKLGPRHGGVLRRGVKCGSSSYIFWPSDIGAFSTVVGRHSSHLDTAIFPFSLLLAKDDRSVLVPGVNLFTSGLYRDARKWIERDRRGDVERPLDLVNPAILSPYILQAMDAGAALVRRSADIGMDLRHGGAVIPASRFEPTLKRYESALIFHLGERLLSLAREARAGGIPEAEDFAQVIRDATLGDPAPSGGRWRDWGGMLLPGMEAERFLADVEKGVLADPEAVRDRLESIHRNYNRYEWIWLAWRWRREYGEPTPAAIGSFAEKWRKTVLFRHECFMKDASKEFSPEVMWGFGVEGDAGEAFHRVRGTLPEHPLVAMAEAERERLLALVKRIPLA